MDDLALVLLGLIALGSFVQGAFLVYVGVSGLRLARRVGALRRSVEEEIRPAADHIARVASDLAEVSELATAQARRVEEMVAETVLRAEEIRARVADAATRPLDSVRDLGAVVKALRRGVHVYRQLGALGAQRRGAARRYADDEHLFI